MSVFRSFGQTRPSCFEGRQTTFWTPASTNEKPLSILNPRPFADASCAPPPRFCPSLSLPSPPPARVTSCPLLWAATSVVGFPDNSGDLTDEVWGRNTFTSADGGFGNGRVP